MPIEKLNEDEQWVEFEVGEDYEAFLITKKTININVRH